MIHARTWKATVGAGLLAAPLLFAQNSSSPATEPPGNVQVAIQSSDPTNGAASVHHALDSLRGRPVQGANGQPLGKLADFMVDTATGALVYAVVEAAGSGESEEFRLVQQSSVRWRDGALQTDLEAEAFAELEKVDAERLAADRLVAVDQESRQMAQSASALPPATAATTPVFGPTSAEQSPEVATPATPQPVTPVTGATPATTEPVVITAADPSASNSGSAPAATHLVRASELVGREIRSGDQPLGRIAELSLNLEQGEAVALVEVESGARAPGRHALPLPRLEFAGEGDHASTTWQPGEETRRQAEQLTAAHAASGATEERLTPTGRMSSDQSSQGGVAPKSSSDAKQDRPHSPAEHGGYDRDRAKSGDGVEASEPESREKSR